jgi:hypothetical protein
MARGLFASCCIGPFLLTHRQKTVEPQAETTYIPLHADRVASGQPYEDISALVEQARQVWGYESFQALLLDTNADETVDFSHNTMPPYVG